MAYIRCSDCGAKALRIATRCPSCRKDLPVRDENGDRILLRHCHGCDVHVPRNTPTCPWCGSEGRAFPWKPALTTAAALLLAGGGGLLLLGRDVSSGARAGSPGIETLPGIEAPSIQAHHPEGVGSGRAHTGIEGTERAVGIDETTLDGGRRSGDRPGDERAEPDLAPDRDWAPAVAVTFVNVRAEPTREAPVLGVVPERASVLLGDLRGGWRRIRAGELSGWVDGRLFRIASSGE